LNGFGFGTLPRYTVLDELEAGNLSAIPIMDVPPQNYLALCSLTGRFKSKAAQELCHVIKREAEKL
jgi:DNA-binding transcriptional LysR family regulator